MRFQLLGPLSITDGPDTVVLQPSKPTILLASLLLHANTVVSADYLQRTMWGEEQPATSRAALQTCVLRLRRLFTKHGVTETPIEAVPGGYRITAGPRHLDLIGFREEVRRAADVADPESELHVLKGALSLWEGSVLANVRSDVLHRDEVPRLVEERLRTLERACDLKLLLGRCGEALVELWSASRAHPGHERFREQLIEALYRTGRQTEALAEYRMVKEYLHDELGVDPSPALRRLELAILRGEDLGPADDRHPAGAAYTSAGNGERRHATAPAAPPSAAVEPVEAVHSFTGREAETTALLERLTAPGHEPVTLLVSGAPGIGKTALARHLAHQVKDSFPAGLFMVRMVAPDGTPRSPDDAAAEVAAALRDQVRGERALLVLDDVVDADQVRPLLPAGADGAVIVTSRRGLAGLVATHGGWVLRLGTFTEEESYALLVAVLGAERVEAEPEEARRLAEACGHHPLALRIMSARLLTRPALRLADSVSWLAEDPLARLSLADSPELSVHRVLGGALDRLDPRLVEAFLKVAAQLPDDFTAEDGVRVLGMSPVEADDVLDRLADAGLLEEGPPGPYRVHELLRVYARRTAPFRSRPIQKV
ncbi:AfsR/SARP family transcriptional regulator [Streptomyces sp. IB2014 016-6]|uniref:AfsR/SARP family transcriptional regulator n=1 Tax=Streptomyces sp. IB2014 016-6 TaxID=2517818 RepID=UPI0011C9F26A|nr:AfsR/SARP family transcriptional regulator [Streptomyces sp. IB2014 016-6]TXL86837.1 AfsR/SARP family transcriptional regulator [Streptomyces sp. IB2014 016-6]